MPIKNWWNKYAFDNDKNYPAPTMDTYYTPWWKLEMKPPPKPERPQVTWWHIKTKPPPDPEISNNNNNNNSFSPYLELTLDNDEIDEKMEENDGSIEENVELAMMALTKYNQVTKHIWLADSGASWRVLFMDIEKD